MGFVRSKAFGIGVTILIIAGLIFVARRTNAGDFVIQGLKGFGQSAGEGLVAPITGLVEGVTQGGRELFSAGGIAGADVQEAFTGNRNAITDFFANLFPSVPPAAGETISQPKNTQQTTLTTNSSQQISGLNFSLPNTPQFAIFNNTSSQTTSDNTQSQTISNTAVDNFFGSGKVFSGPIKLG